MERLQEERHANQSPASPPSQDIWQVREGAVLDIPSPTGTTGLRRATSSVPCPGPHHKWVILHNQVLEEFNAIDNQNHYLHFYRGENKGTEKRHAVPKAPQ